MNIKDAKKQKSAALQKMKELQTMGVPTRPSYNDWVGECGMAVDYDALRTHPVDPALVDEFERARIEYARAARFIYTWTYGPMLRDYYFSRE